MTFQCLTFVHCGVVHHLGFLLVCSRAAVAVWSTSAFLLDLGWQRQLWSLWWVLHPLVSKVDGSETHSYVVKFIALTF